MQKLSEEKKKEIIKKYGKIPSKKEVFEKIKESQERLIVSLAAAWETAPDDIAIRKVLLETIEKAVNLRERIYSEVVKEEAPDVKKSYEKLKMIIKNENNKTN